MTTKTVTRTYTMVEEDCPECGLVFMVPDFWEKQMQETKRTWYCPNGHEWVFTEGEADRLRRELAAAKKATERERNNVAHWREQYAHMDRRRAAAKGQLTKALNRLQAGQCVHCDAYSEDLASHMRMQHPNEPESTLAEHDD